MNTALFRSAGTRIAALIFLLAAGSPALQADTPQAINYQAIARDVFGNPLSNRNVRVQARIHRGGLNGTVVYSETQLATTSAGGQFSIRIGAGTADAAAFDTVNWGGFTHFLQIGLDPGGGTTFTDMGTQQLVSVPYAFHSNTSAAVSGTASRIPVFTSPTALGDSSLFQNGTFIGIGKTNPAVLLDVAGTVQGDLGLHSGQEVTAVTAITAGTSVNAGSAINAGTDITAGGTLTVEGNKGIVRNASANQLKVIRTGLTLSAFALPSNGFSGDTGVELTYEAFGGPPTVMVGNCIVQNGEWYKVTITAINVTTTKCNFRIFNPSNGPVSFTNAQWQVLIIGPE